MRNEAVMPFLWLKVHRNNRTVEICISVAQTARLFTTMKRLHQQSIGQQARSPNPPYGREIHSNPQTVQWLLSLLESVHVCSLKCRIEPGRWGCLPCYPMRNHNWASGNTGSTALSLLMGMWPICTLEADAKRWDKKSHFKRKVWILGEHGESNGPPKLPLSWG